MSSDNSESNSKTPSKLVSLEILYLKSAYMSKGAVTFEFLLKCPIYKAIKYCFSIMEMRVEESKSIESSIKSAM